MKYDLFPTLDAMLAPETLSELTGETITSVHCKPSNAVGYSGSQLLNLETNEGKGTRYFLKRISWDRDWIMRASDDRCGREVMLWQRGLLDQLPPEASHAIIACAIDGPGWAILMHDISTLLLPLGWNPENFFGATQYEACLNTLAVIHAQFLDQPVLADPELGLSSLHHLITITAPETGLVEIDAPSVVPKEIVEGWDRLKTIIEPDITDILFGLLNNPQPIYDALSRYPQTLVHGDCRPANLGFSRSPQRQIILLDWQMAAVAPPAMDLAWYIADVLIPISKDEAIAFYRQALARHLGPRFIDEWWQPQLELCLLADFLRQGWSFCLRLLKCEDDTMRAYWQDALIWWSEKARAGARRL